MQKNTLKLIIPLLLIAGLVTLIFYLTHGDIAVLNPKGTVAGEQRTLIYIALGLMLIVVLPVFALTVFITWRYREGNTKATYRPNWDGNKKLELIWWGVPFIIILILAGITWHSSHSLDPYRPLVSDKKPITIQVVALQWKWLFIYPEEHIATVNYVTFPENTPVNFEITADAPMNSFWIPQLGGQVYAMAGMQTKLHLMADEAGTFAGSSANLSGEGFADMKFTAVALSGNSFTDWVQSAQRSPQKLTLGEYTTLARSDTKVTASTYASPAPNLYDTVMMKYMEPSPAQNGNGHDHEGMHGH